MFVCHYMFILMTVFLCVCMCVCVNVSVFVRVQVLAYSLLQWNPKAIKVTVLLYFAKPPVSFTFTHTVSFTRSVHVRLVCLFNPKLILKRLGQTKCALCGFIRQITEPCAIYYNQS